MGNGQAKDRLGREGAVRSALKKNQASWLEWNRKFQLEETFKDHPVQMPNHFRANQKLQHIQEGIVHMPLGHW